MMHQVEPAWGRSYRPKHQAARQRRRAQCAVVVRKLYGECQGRLGLGESCQLQL